MFGLFVGWGTREALIIAGMTAMSSSAIITKLLIELRRLANRETPTVLGIAVVEDVFIAIYLAIVSVVLSGETEVWPIVLQLATAFAFLITMFVVARFGGRFISRLIGTRDDELFTIVFFGLALAFGGLGSYSGCPTRSGPSSSVSCSERRASGHVSSSSRFRCGMSSPRSSSSTSASPSTRVHSATSSCRWPSPSS